MFVNPPGSDKWTFETMKKTFSTIFSLFLTAFCLHAGDLQWASELVFQYNQYGSDDWSGHRSLGQPDAIPAGTLNKNAFRLKTEKGYGTLTVGFQEPRQISEILIVESHDPGRIVKIVLIDTQNNEHIAFQAPARKIDQDYRQFQLKIPRTTYKVAQISVHLDTYSIAGWPQIDAIGLSEDGLPPDNLLASANGEMLGLPMPAAESGISGAPDDGGKDDGEGVTFYTKKEKLSNMVNSAFLECKPVISPDGNRLYFARRNAPANIGGKKDDQDIYYSDLVKDEWQEAVNAGKPLNDRYPNGVCSVSPDGNTLLLINAYYDNGIPEADGMSISRKTKAGWSKPQRQEIDGFENFCPYQDYFLSNSGKVLLLALQMQDTQGDQDLYVSFRVGNNRWSKPKNIGKTVNTAKVEFAPFLASDDKTLYFSSNGHAGFGEADIFYTKRLDDTWLNWSEPVNIGEAVNTKYWDGYYTISAKSDFAYFVSTDGPRSKVDMNPVDEDLYRISLNREERPEPVVLVSGQVIDSESKLPIEANIYYENLDTKQEEGIAVSDPNNGQYQITLPAGKRYGFRAEAEGYLSINENLDVTDISEYKEVARNLMLTPILVGKIIALNNLFFVQSKAEILPESLPELERLYKILIERPTLEIELGGHTDNQGVYAANMKLSQERAEAVMQYLIDRGIEKKRLKAVGYGPTKPVASNANAESRQSNRRVEVKILKN